MIVSVVIPVFNAAASIADCLRALLAQSLPRAQYEVIVIDDGSRDESAAIVSTFEGVRLIRQQNAGAPAARNAGIRAASGRWVAFTDADCIPSRNWLQRLVRAAEDASGTQRAFGAAGSLRGYASETPAARFVDLSAGLDAERHLSHPRFPFAPSANLMYRRDLLAAAGGFEERYVAYDACDLHQRLRSMSGLPFLFEPAALVLHRHRASWRAYWRQQRGYGAGYAQFFLHHGSELYWGVADEARALWSIAAHAAAALRPGRDDAALMRRGVFVRALAQHAGFLRTLFDDVERRRWGAPKNQLAPRAVAARVAAALRPRDLALAVAMAAFVVRLPHALAKTDLPMYLETLRRMRRGRAPLERVLRVRAAVLRVLRRSDTCYARAFALYRFLDVAPGALELRLGLEPARHAGDRLRGHAWVLLDNALLEGPGDAIVQRSRDIVIQPAAT